MSARSQVTPLRLRRWTPPEPGARFRRAADGKEFALVMSWPRDQQVRLEAADGEHVCPFANQLRSEWEAMGS